MKEAETKITAETALRAYQVISDRGTPVGGGREYAGVRAELDHDGYGVTIGDGIVTVRVLFHNKVSIDTPNSRSLTRFRKRLSDLVGE